MSLKYRYLNFQKLLRKHSWSRPFLAVSGANNFVSNRLIHSNLLGVFLIFFCDQLTLIYIHFFYFIYRLNCIKITRINISPLPTTNTPSLL